MKNRKQKEKEIKEMREAYWESAGENLRKLCERNGISIEKMKAKLEIRKMHHGDVKMITVLGRNIKKQRLQQGISLQQLSDETLMPVMYLEDIENGNIDPDVTDIHIIAKFINSPVYVLYIGCD